jgi:hypothetical protein
MSFSFDKESLQVWAVAIIVIAAFIALALSPYKPKKDNL